MTHVTISAATIFLFLYLSPLTTTAADTTAVLDIDGHPLQAGTNYYILPVIRSLGGGLTLSSKNATQLCPPYVAQEKNEVSNGLPLKFYPVNPNDKIISLYSDLNIVFDVEILCLESTVWSLTLDGYVGGGGEIGSPGRDTLGNWFKIEKVGSGKYDYRIVFCPYVCELCTVACGPVGVFTENDGRRLLKLFSVDEPDLLVRFKKAEENIRQIV